MTKLIMVFAFVLGLSAPAIAETPKSGEDNTAKLTWTLSAMVHGNPDRAKQILAELAED